MPAKLLLTVLLLLCNVLPAEAADLGVVLLHGKTGTPGQLGKLAAALETAGYAVETPEMCWSKTRIFDKTFADCLKEVDVAVAELKAKGATKIVVGGTSQGAVAAIAYGAATAGLAGVIAMAPAADPPNPSKFPDFATAIKGAQAAVKSGKGDDPASFADLASGKSILVNTTAAIFLSFHDPKSPAATIRSVKTKLVPKLTAPLLWVAGTNDPTQTGAKAAFDAAPANGLSRLVQVDADHAGTPDASGEAIIAWLKTLP